VALSGFPYLRDVRSRFADALERTGWRAADADLRLLCLHQIVEGACVGVQDFTFTHDPEVIRARELPPFAAVLSGHIHRMQVLRHDLAGRPLPAPVLYPGSVERTSADERAEEKGTLRIEVAPSPAPAPPRVAVHFERLPTRPWVGLDRRGFEDQPGRPPAPLPG